MGDVRSSIASVKYNMYQYVNFRLESKQAEHFKRTENRNASRINFSPMQIVRRHRNENYEQATY
ncbi:hypothetical protein T4D_6697 [Trichinella pseudospiralis]|uniref:Uncharacterized protein n=1 Tax=Trichinella pseudospiralis TaxID=6337 RepID=A0A0V1FIG9_TRIPS|nr:hypothetical protein T4D_6697 [Trichinella pseudospiralis]